MATTTPTRNSNKSIIQNLLAMPWIRGIFLSLLGLACARAFTYIPAPVNTPVQVTLVSLDVTPARQWVAATKTVTALSTISVTVGQPTTSDGQDLPPLGSLNDAITGQATCVVRLRNLIGIELVTFTLSTDFVIDSQGVTLANPRAFPGGGFLYSVTTAEESFGNASNYPAARASISIRVDVALGSTSGANVDNFSMYVTMDVTSASEFTCTLDSAS